MSDRKTTHYAKEWRLARGITQAQAGEAIEKSEAQISRIENGKSSLTEDMTVKLAAAYGTTPSGLYQPPPDGTEPTIPPAPKLAPAPVSTLVPGPQVNIPYRSEMPRDLPVRGTAACSSGNGAFQFETAEGYGSAIDWVLRPPMLNGIPEAYALYMSGDSMEPKLAHGDLVLVHPKRPVRPGDLVVLILRDGPNEPEYAFCKRLVRRHAGVVTVEQFNPAKTRDFPEETVIAMHRILEISDLFGG